MSNMEAGSSSEEVDEQKKYRESQSEVKVSFNDYWRIFSYGTKWDMVVLGVGSVAALGSGVTLPLMNIVFGKLVGAFNGYFQTPPASTEEEFNDTIDSYTLYIVYLFIAKFLLCYISMFSFRITSTRLSAAIRLDYLSALFRQSVSELDKLPPGEAASTITSAANTLQIGISDKVATFLQFSALLVSAYIVAFIYSWKLTLVTSTILLFCVMVYSVIVPISMKLQKGIDHVNGKAAAIASETFGSIRMVAACGAEDRVSRNYSKWIEEGRRRGLAMSLILGLQFAPVYFSIFADFALTFWFGCRLYVWGDIENVGTVLIVLMSVLMAVMTLGNIVAPLSSATKAATAASTFFNMIDRPVANRGGLKEPEVSPQNDIILDNITFAYPSRPHVKVLDGMDVVFEAGKLTAVVGPSGSGKSTIVGLIERWYELSSEKHDASDGDSQKITESEKKPGLSEDTREIVASGGTIKCGECPLKDTELKWWRSQIGLVQQEPFIFNDTILANVAYGLVGSKFEHDNEESKRKRVEAACQEAFADEFINKLPERYDTQVGDAGLKLSGGQRQRLAIARSIIKRPQILIFDEATSAIDVRGERIVQAALDRVARNRTTITIAHRLSTIRKADKIVVVAKGRVVEQGTHDELIRTIGGVYHNLVAAQKIMMGDEEPETSPEPVSEMVAASNDLAVKEKEPLMITEAEIPYKRRGLVRSFGFLIFEQRAYLHWLVLTVIACAGAGAAVPLQAYLFAKVITVFQYPRDDPQLATSSQYWALMFVYLAIGIGACNFFMAFFSNTLSIHISSAYRQEYFDSITHKDISFFDAEENSSGTLVSRVANDPTQLQELMGINMGMVTIAFFSLTGCLIISFYFGWKLSLVALCAALPFTFVAGYFRLRHEIQFEKMNAAVFAESSKFAAECFGAVRTVTSLTLEEMICRRYSVLLQNHVNKAVRKARFTTLIFALSDSINMLCMALTFWYGGHLMSSLEYNPVQWLVIYTAIIQGSENAGQWCSFGPNAAQAAAASNRILSIRPRGGSKSSAPATGLLEIDGGVAIEIKDVHFQYPTRDIPIFSGLNLSIEKGQFAALVGSSGCGKSTIISLLEQFYTVQRGTISCAGIDISTLDVKEYRKAISLVAQEATLFQGTIRENILLGVDDGTISEQELYQACRDAEIHDFISSLTDAYNTDIGSKGVALSGGQKQRIAIARALIRNPSILLLDEATSSLDSESEKLVQSAFERAGKGRTMVVVAHRLATVQNADVIFVLGSAGEGMGARVLEKGSHSELIAKRGVYFQMCQSQALDR